VDVFSQTARFLVDLSKRHQSVLVAVSGGKDSLATLDLCARCFRTIHAMHAYFVPDLEVVERQLEYAERRWQVKIARYPHSHFYDYVKAGYYCYPSVQASIAKIKKVTFTDILRVAQAECGAELVALGQKKVDNFSTRARKDGMKSGDFVYPLTSWRHQDVFAYLSMRKIPRPESDGRASSSMDLSTPCLLWLYDHHRDDFNRIARFFPDAVGVSKRREWFGVGETKDAEHNREPDESQEEVRR
jgi:phosphoadenosine phosphosulfate reductase